jgi:hypothetical protein
LSAPAGVTLRRRIALVMTGSESISSSADGGANLPKNESPP